METLYLSLKKGPFDVMVTGEKDWEYRSPSDWIRSRLLGKETRFRKYDRVHFTNGYGKHRPYFIAECLYVGVSTLNIPLDREYSNGFRFTQQPGDFVIQLGRIIEKGNLIQN